ncbi:unnamed protein product, partial [Mesorhabditis belari]|uniref:Uncharacterized protein n=1 Tax=Mesorhabditis belari TaxID=2138241 RepID=A0AAF3F9C4_9BILA
MEVLVLPASDFEVEHFFVLVDKNVLATIVVNETNIANDGPTLEIKAFNLVDVGLVAFSCQYTLPENVCSKEVTYSYYFGTDPGLAKNERYHIMEATVDGSPITTRTRATSVFTNEECAFCLRYQPNQLYMYQEEVAVWTPYYFPWFPDNDAQDRLSCYYYQDQFQTSGQEVQATFEVKLIDGGAIDFKAYPAPICNYNGHESFTKTFLPEMSGTKFEFIAVCYKIFWCPDYDQEPAPGNGYVVLAQFKSITISAFDGADFDIDYAQNGCNAVHLSEPDRSNVEQINAPCWDPLPFSIEGRTLTAESGEVMLYTHANDSSGGDFQGFFYITRFKIMNASQLVVRAASKSGTESAISFQVRQWVDENKKTFVVPGLNNDTNSAQDSFFVVVKNNYIVTVVPSPETYRLNNEGPLTMIKFIQTDPLSTNPECKTFQQELSCLNHVQDSYPVYAGGNPGLKRNASHLVITIGSGVKVHVRSTAVTAFSQNGCDFCFQFDSRFPEEELLDVNLDTTTLWTPFWYPWLFDQPDLIAYALMNSHQYYNKAPKVLAQNDELWSLSVDRCDGGRLQVNGFHLTGQSCGNTYTPAFDGKEKSTQSTYFFAACINISWSNDLPPVGYAGFTLRLSYHPSSHPPTLWTDALESTSTEMWTNLIIYIDEAVDLIMDFTKLPCNNKACTDPPQFTVNNITLEVDSDDTIVSFATNRNDTSPYAHYCVARLKLKSLKELHISRNDQRCDADSQYAVSFRVTKWVNESVNVLLLPDVVRSTLNLRDADNDANYYYFLIEENTIAVVVPDEFHYDDGPFSLIRPISRDSLYSAEFNDCPLYRQQIQQHSTQQNNQFYGSLCYGHMVCQPHKR